MPPVRFALNAAPAETRSQCQTCLQSFIGRVWTFGEGVDKMHHPVCVLVWRLKKVTSLNCFPFFPFFIKSKISQLPMARPSLKLCIPSPMMTIQAMLAIPASFISWSEWQFPPCEWPWPCLWCLVLCPFSLVSDWWAFAGASGVLLVGDSGVWSSVSCVSLCPLSQETAVLSGSGADRRCYSDGQRDGAQIRVENKAEHLPSLIGFRCSHSASERRFNLWSDNFLPILPSSFTFFKPCVQRNQHQIKALWLWASASAGSCSSHPLVFVVLEHANTVFNDEEEVNAG